MASFTVVGVGTGTQEYVLPIAKEMIEQADILIGGERNLKTWRGNLAQEYLSIKSPLENIVDFIKVNYTSKNIVILVSGDPGFYSFLSLLLQNFAQEEIKVIPGISSIQLAFARLALPWDDALLLNLHGRSLDILAKHLNHPKIALLTDPKNNPQVICDYLLANGQKNSTIHICTNLGYPNEEINTVKINALSSLEHIKLLPSVLVILNE